MTWDYLSSPFSSPSPASPDTSAAAPGDFWSRLGGAFGRSQAAGGGMAGLFSALNPNFAGGFMQGNKPLQVSPPPMTAQPGQPSQPAAQGGGLKL